MAEVREGRLAAFQALYERHHRALFTFLLRFVADRPTAEDLLQDTFLRVYLHRDTYRPSGTFRTWLFTIARNLALDHSRHRGQVVGEEIPDYLTIPDPSPGPVEQIEGKALLVRLEGAISRLPPAQREVLLLSRFAGLSHGEIAQVTGATLTAVRVTLHRALRSLRTLLESKE